jgi:hypothetical protein
VGGKVISQPTQDRNHPKRKRAHARARARERERERERESERERERERGAREVQSYCNGSRCKCTASGR